MNELVERYVHQVGQYLPPKERAEIVAELRSQLEDQLDDRCEGKPTQDDTAAVLAEWGHPYRIAASYRDPQYLIGPELYPVMMQVLRHGWLIIPAIVLFLNVFAQLTSSQPVTFLGLVVEPFLAALYVTFIFSSVVVLIFAIVQHSGEALKEPAETFNPLDLPKVDAPGVVDRFEAAFGITFGAIALLVLLYWLQVGGLTLRFNLSDPGDVIPAPAFWLGFLVAINISLISTHLIVMRRNRWSAGMWLVETVIETVGIFGMYFAVFKPVFERIIADNPSLADAPLLGNAPEIIAVISAIITLAGKSSRLIKLWNQRSGSLFIQADSSHFKVKG